MIAIVLSLLMLFQKAPFVPPGAVEGTLKTLDGGPAIAVRVVAYKVPGSGNPDDNLNYFELDRPVSSTQTDNDGNYSMMDLPPGRYYIMAGTAGQGTYYPGTPDLKNAAKITVASNEIAGGLDIRLLNRYGGKISGKVNADMAALGWREITITGPPLQDLVEVPIKPDGSFQIPHLPEGTYSVSVYPPPSGMPSHRIKVTDTDISAVELTPLPTKTVTGRIVAKKGPIPISILGFETPQTKTGATYVGATINADGTFVAQLHSAHFQVNVDGLPVGYSIASVRVGNQDRPDGSIDVGNSDISDLVITLDVPKALAVVRGRITGLDPSRYSSTRVDLTGYIIGALQASVRPDGTFEFPAVTPGLYTLKLNSVSEFSSMLVSVDAVGTFNVTVVVPPR